MMYFDPSSRRSPLPPPVWMHEDVFEHFHMSESDRNRIAQYIIEQESIGLTTVGIDIGSSTTHLLFAKIVLQRETQRLSSRFVVIEREIVWRSPIMLTPFTGTGSIDAHRLEHFFADCYRDAGFRPQDIDSGAVILTGEAIKQKNARVIDHLFAGEAGKFVCATAGHQLEATLAAHGSGAVRLSRERGECLLHVDIGGGTTKLALIDNGVILGACAFAVGGRLIARNGTGRWTRVDHAATLAAKDLGFETGPDSMESADVRAAIADRLADVAMDFISGRPRDSLGTSLLLTEDLVRSRAPAAITFSGGISEYLFGREKTEYGDIAMLLASAIRERLRNVGVPVLDPGNGIRATVIGASQFTVQVSGKTIFISNPGVLPLRNVPVIHVQVPPSVDPDAISASIARGLVRADLDAGALFAIAFEWARDPNYHDLLRMCRGIAASVASRAEPRPPLVVLVDGDVGKTIGHLLHDELGVKSELVSIDGVTLHELDFVDVGELLTPPGVIPLVIKSLLFS
ncbi:MAG TPA: ethanolamine ammonia-lyase reactivating factor EutA [Candidatus Acidoferrales bacterium]|nr:ethanolamine ammonia-lyase reactivating factor EutA [Candidatus Acidoferrales bacterium]